MMVEARYTCIKHFASISLAILLKAIKTWPMGDRRFHVSSHVKAGRFSWRLNVYFAAHRYVAEKNNVTFWCLVTTLWDIEKDLIY
jgi:hypothetical protein